MTNTGDQSVHKVVVTHKITPNLPVTRMPDQCALGGEVIRCEYGTLAPGEEVEGILEADLPEDLAGSVQISGRVSWQQDAS